MKCIFTVSFCLIMNFLYAQTFPVAGDTWIFENNHPTFANNYAQKWKYVGDSVTAAGIVKKMEVTTKIENPHWFPWDTVIVQKIDKDMLFVGDTVFASWDSSITIANFSAQVGDSLHTPYYNMLNLMILSMGCSHADSALVFGKGEVTAIGTDNEDGLQIPYYILTYNNHNGNVVNAKITKRQLVFDYWEQVGQPFCSTTDLPEYPTLSCYYDNLTPAGPCAQSIAFDHLSVNENTSLSVSIFPNPTSDMLHVQFMAGKPISVSITDMQGHYMRTAKTASTNFTVSLEDIPAGMYLMYYTTSDGVRGVQKFVKQ